MKKSDNVVNPKAKTKNTGDNIDSDYALKILKEGNKRFESNTSINRDLEQEIKDTSSGQSPFAAVLSCIDSRVSSELIFDQGIGDIFNFRVAGNFVDAKRKENNNILGSLEFASGYVKVILVLGHTGCGAINAAVGKPSPDWCKPMAKMVKRLRSNLTTKKKNKATIENVYKTIRNIRKHSKCLRESERTGNIQIRGGVYDITTGKVSFLPYSSPKKETK